MMGPRQVEQAALFYEFSLERHVPATHLLRSIDRFVDLSDVRSYLAPFTALLVGLRLIPNCSSGCCWLATATAFARSVGCAKRFTLTSLTAGSVGSVSMARFRTTRPSRRIGMAASATAICCESCLRPWSDVAWQKGWLMVRPLLSMPA